jgi:hypothetical protein
LTRINDLWTHRVRNKINKSEVGLLTTPDTSHARMNGFAIGWALSVVLVAFLLACAVFALSWPTSAFGQGRVAVFGAPLEAPITNLAAGIPGSIATAWLVADVFVGAPHRLRSRSKNDGKFVRVRAPGGTD